MQKHRGLLRRHRLLHVLHGLCQRGETKEYAQVYFWWRIDPHAEKRIVQLNRVCQV